MAALGERYTIARQVGEGGTALVYLAHDRQHDRPVAVKVLRPELAAAVGTERFLREIRTLARLNHPNILPLLDSGEADGQLYYVMPFVEGESLRDRLRRERQLPLDDAIAIAREVADALAYAHSHGIVHRDIKPENVLLTAGHAVVADFGIARAITTAGGDQLTETGVAIGTPQYMSPEQASGEHALDGRTDLYALGCVLYEMLAGEPPFQGTTAQAVIARHALDPVPPLRTVRSAVPAAVEAVVHRAVAKVPADRFATATAFAQALVGSTEERQGFGVPWQRWRRRKSALYGSVVTLVLAAFAGYGLLARDDARVPGAREAARRSVAVLPFADLSPERDQEYFGDGIAEELINALTRVSGLRVVARTSSFAFKGTNTDIRTIGRRLGVGTVVEGSVRKVGDRLRITAHLIDVSTGYDLWSETYAREARDLFAIQDEIARAIVGTLRVTLAATADRSPLRGQPTADLEAYHAFLKGRHFLAQRTEASMEKAVEYFQEAVRRDANFATAYVGLADAYLLLRIWGPRRREEVIPSARRAVLRALELAPELAEAHATLGLLRWWDERDLPGAARALERAIALNPGYATAHHWYSLYLGGIGAWEQALAEMRRAQELDPLSLIIATIWGTRFYFAGRVDEAIAQYRRALELDPDYRQAHLWLGMAYATSGRAADGVRHLELAGARDSTGDPIARAGLAYALARSGRHAEARSAIAELERRSRRRYVQPYWIACAYAGLGDTEQAFAWLDRAFREHDGFLLNVKFDPVFAPLRSDPRFPQLLQTLGLGSEPPASP